MKKTLAALVLMAISVPGLAATRTVTLSVPGMTCPACPFTVRKALSKVEGVTRTEVRFEKHEAVVVFDDARTSAPKLVEAIRNAGYPSWVKP